jgi:predicted transcriptional regulator
VGGSLESVAQHIIDHLSVNPYITIKSISQNLNIAFTTASRSIEKLEIITQTSNGKRDKVYCSHEILKILEEPAKILENFDSVL